VLAVEVEVRVEGDFAVIGVLPDDDDRPGVARVAHRLDDRAGRARRLDADVRAAPFGLTRHPRGALCGRVLFDVERGGGPEGACCGES
jgi:hypothetical protein